MKHGRQPERFLSVLEVVRPLDIPSGFGIHAEFACLLAWDADRAPDEEVAAVASRLLAAGCVYICAWGSDCERVHDIFDAVGSERTPDNTGFISTWHENETLDEAIEFLLFVVRANSMSSGELLPKLGIAVGSREWGARMRKAIPKW